MSKWPMATLGEVCLFENGDRGENYPSRSVQTASGVPFINAGHLTDSGICYDAMNYIPRERFDLLGNGKIQKGDILFCLRGSLGKFATVGALFEGAIASSLVIVRPQQTVLDRYVLAYFQSDLCSEMIDAFRNGAAQPNLSAGSLKKFPIPVPPLVEQRRVVTILDEAFASIAMARANAEKNLQNARELFESRLEESFASDWATSRFAKLADLATDITDGDHMPPPKSASGIPFITISNIDKQTRSIDLSDTFLVSRAYFDALKPSRRPKKGDVLYTVTGSFGIPVLVDSDVDFCFQRHIALVRPNLETNSKWLYYLLVSPRTMIQAIAGATGTAQKTVSLRVLRNLVVPRVSRDRQRTTVENLDKMSLETQRLQSIYRRKLAALDELKQSLLHEAFSGKL